MLVKDEGMLGLAFMAAVKSSAVGQRGHGAWGSPSVPSAI